MGLETRLETGWEITPRLEIIFAILSTVQHLLPMFHIPAKRVDEVKTTMRSCDLPIKSLTSTYLRLWSDAITS